MEEGLVGSRSGIPGGVPVYVPVVIPFLFIANVRLALRLSNGIALVMLFLAGYGFGLYAEYRPWRMGLSTAILGSALVGIAVVLGG